MCKSPLPDRQPRRPSSNRQDGTLPASRRRIIPGRPLHSTLPWSNGRTPPSQGGSTGSSPVGSSNRAAPVAQRRSTRLLGGGPGDRHPPGAPSIAGGPGPARSHKPSWPGAAPGPATTPPSPCSPTGRGTELRPLFVTVRIGLWGPECTTSADSFSVGACAAREWATSRPRTDHVTIHLGRCSQSVLGPAWKAGEPPCPGRCDSTSPSSATREPMSQGQGDADSKSA